jgi:CRISPR-associated endonuclease/helicase Cas3
MRCSGRPLVFAVPTRTATRQLHGRVNETLRRVLDADTPEAVLAIPGMLRAKEFGGQRLSHWRVKWDDDATLVPQRWVAEHATRFLAAPVGVGTVDQTMLAGLG